LSENYIFWDWYTSSSAIVLLDLLRLNISRRSGVREPGGKLRGKGFKRPQ
jgi:hypothetical protein